jgi:LysM repeat protein
MHVVSRGEWLLQIARCYGAPYQGILAANAIPNPNFILPGAVIRVPAIGSQGTIIGPPCVMVHIVTATDTWSSLAQRYGTTTAILQLANPGALTVGRPIWVPRAP